MALDTPDTRAPLKIAAAQYSLDELASFDDWKEKLSKWVAEGAATGADILVFPEYAAMEVAATFGSEVASDLKLSLAKVSECAGERLETHVTLARQHGVMILAGSGPQQTSDSRYVNAAQLVTPSGLVGEQHKLMMTPFERDWGISAGTSLTVFKTQLANFAIAICYDSEFPMIARAAAEGSAECLLVPSCTDRISGFQRVKTGAMARALENTIVAVQSPTVGEALWSPAIDHNAGAAGIYVPAEHGVSDTGIVAEGTLNKPGWVTGEVDLSRLNRLRTGGEMRNYHDWELQPGAINKPPPIEIVDLLD